MEREGENDRHTERGREGQIDGERERRTDRWRERERTTDIQREGENDRHTERGREGKTDRESIKTWHKTETGNLDAGDQQFNQPSSAQISRSSRVMERL